MQSEGPPLERVLLYVDALERLRAEKAEISCGDFVLELETLSADVVRDDFVVMGLPWKPRGKVDLNQAYWAVVDRQAKAEGEIESSATVGPVFPAEAEILAALPRRETPERAAHAVQAAQMLDLSFDSFENLDLALLAHGRMTDGAVAFPHQLKTARYVMEDMNGLAIIADEVGLGKTNVAGLILEELFAHEPNASALILVPANLRTQWAEIELPRYFKRQAFTNGRALSAIEKAPVVLLSLDQAKRTGKGEVLSTVLLRRKWDLLIVDEAHDCRNADRLRFKFVYSLQAKRRVFLTATPIHNSGYDIFNLATLLKPGCFGQRRFFAEQHMNGERILKESDALQQSVKPLMMRTLREDTEIPFAERKIKTIVIKNFKDEETKLYDRLLTLLQEIYQRHMGGAAPIVNPSGSQRHVSQFVLIAMLVLREMASHPLAAIETLKTALRKRVEEFAKISRNDADLNRLDEFIADYTSQSWEVDQHAKSERLLEEAAKLLKAGKKFVIYVNYRKTHQLLLDELASRHRGSTIVSYEGSLGREEKDAAIKLFKAAPKTCLVSTDCGGQGLNLQFAECVINYDFPWNPMRIEQRIGRVDRVRSKEESAAIKEVKILNFRTRGTVEEYVQIVLTAKIKEVRAVLGEFQSPLQIEKVYEDKLTMFIGRELMEARDAADMRKRMINFGVDDLRRSVEDYAEYEKDTPPTWTWRPHD
ncbi:MAG TPA: SNF2-related protein [Pyrinomonadaceae bacterium]|nr:SNF2-related protein [Pyrinomonadaceae bacterium]